MIGAKRLDSRRSVLSAEILVAILAATRPVRRGVAK
jgi:hypothetical protein